MFYVEQNYAKHYRNVPRRTIYMNYVKEQMFFLIKMFHVEHSLRKNKALFHVEHFRVRNRRFLVLSK